MEKSEIALRRAAAEAHRRSRQATAGAPREPFRSTSQVMRERLTEQAVAVVPAPARIRLSPQLDPVRAARYRLARTRRDLDALEARRQVLMARRAEDVDLLRSAGLPWSQVVSAAGVSRVALIRAGARDA